jgi:hypothetical protein
MEVFLAGNEPAQTDNLYRSLQINRNTRQLATVFTPPELVIEEVFFFVPPEARTWAEQAGFNLPPEDYDLIFAPTTLSATAAITSPVFFDYVRGRVTLNGNAGGENFASYRLQYGAGLNPQTWTLITEQTTPVKGGELAVWDTQGLSGAYVVQLSVITKFQQVEKATIQVTIDNTSPQVVVLNPAPGQTYPYPQTTQLLFQAQVSDNYGISQVVFFLDDQLIANLSEEPFAALWQTRIGIHILRVIAYDLAGNATETTVEFSLER